MWEEKKHKSGQRRWASNKSRGLSARNKRINEQKDCCCFIGRELTVVNLITVHAEVNYHEYKIERGDNPDRRYCRTADCELQSHIRRLPIVSDFIEEPCTNPRASRA